MDTDFRETRPLELTGTLDMDRNAGYGQEHHRIWTGTLDMDWNAEYGQEHRIRTGTLETNNAQEPGSLAATDAITGTE